jgi:hypothetical protein
MHEQRHRSESEIEILRTMLDALENGEQPNEVAATVVRQMIEEAAADDPLSADRWPPSA